MAEINTSFHIGADIGGTFTDMVLVDNQGELYRVKAPTTPEDYTQGIMECLNKAARVVGIPVEEILQKTRIFFNGTTIVTNAVAEIKGIKVGLVTTKGFKDTLRIARSARTNDYNLQTQIPLPELVARDCIIEVDERVDSSGHEVVKLNEDQVRQGLRYLVEEKGVEGLAVCFLWSFKNAAHEERVKTIAHEMFPDMFISASVEIYPVYREYERMVTTVLNTFSGRGVADYLSRLETVLRARDLKVPVAMMQSVGGVMTPAEARNKPIYLLNSGPVGGVIGANNLGQHLGLKNIITSDMGGTSFDTALIEDNKPSMAYRAMVDGFLTGLSMVEISAIGAGGGSICWLDQRGVPRVGPQSAGASPGPACYGKGGTKPTVTDVALALNLIDPEYFLGGEMKLDKSAAVEAIDREIAQPLGWNVNQAAAGLYRIVINSMANAVRAVTIEKGKDPREFTMISYGGAGPLFIGEICRHLGIKTIVIPANAAVFSAYGLLWSDNVRTVVRTSNWSVSHGSIDEVNSVYQERERDARQALLDAGFREDEIKIVKEGDFKFAGQVYELTMPIGEQQMTDADRERIVNSFVQYYERVYGEDTAWVGSEVTMLNCRVTGIGHSEKPTVKEMVVGSSECYNAISGERKVLLPDVENKKVPIYDDRKLVPGNIVPGPAIVEVVDTTIYVPTGAKLQLDKFRNYVMEL